MLEFNELLNKWKIAKEIKEVENFIEYTPCEEYISLINKFLMDRELIQKEKEILNHHLAACPECRIYTYKTKVNMPHIPKKIHKALENRIKQINEELFKKYKKEVKKN